MRCAVTLDDGAGCARVATFWVVVDCQHCGREATGPMCEPHVVSGMGGQGGCKVCNAPLRVRRVKREPSRRDDGAR